MFGRPTGSFRQGQHGMTEHMPSGGAKSDHRKGPNQVDETKRRLTGLSCLQRDIGTDIAVVDGRLRFLQLQRGCNDRYRIVYIDSAEGPGGQAKSLISKPNKLKRLCYSSVPSKMLYSSTHVGRPGCDAVS